MSHPRRTECDTPSHSRITPISAALIIQYERPSFPLIQNDRQNYSSVLFFIYLDMKRKDKLFWPEQQQQAFSDRSTILHLFLFSCSYISQSDSRPSYKCPDDSKRIFCSFLLSPTYYIHIAQADVINHRFSSGIRLLALPLPLPLALTVKWL